MINTPTQDQLNKIPQLYATEHTSFEQKLVYAHFYLDQCHWWAMEFDGQDTFFGYVLLNGWLQDAELGYFSLSELEKVKIAGCLQVQCDPTWVIKPLSNIGLIQEILSFQHTVRSRHAQSCF